MGLKRFVRKMNRARQQELVNEMILEMENGNKAGYLVEYSVEDLVLTDFYSREFK